MTKISTGGLGYVERDEALLSTLNCVTAYAEKLDSQIRGAVNLLESATIGEAAHWEPEMIQTLRSFNAEIRSLCETVDRRRGILFANRPVKVPEAA